MGADDPVYRGLTRRDFVELLGLATLALGTGCGGSRDDLDSEEALLHADRTLRALINTMVPAEPGSPGAVQCRATEVMRLRHFLSIGIGMGFIAKPPQFTDAALDGLDAVLREWVVVDLDQAAARVLGVDGAGRRFVDLPPSQQTEVVTQQMANGAMKPLYLLVRASSLIAFVGAPLNDAGMATMGITPYEDFNDNRHSSGFSDYSRNAVPSVDGRTVHDLTVDGDLP
jgi:hypothetical protein